MAAATGQLVPRGPTALDRLQDKGAMIAATRHLVPMGPEARDRLQDKEQPQQLHRRTWRPNSPSSRAHFEMVLRKHVES